MKASALTRVTHLIAVLYTFLKSSMFPFAYSPVSTGRKSESRACGKRYMSAALGPAAL